MFLCSAAAALLDQLGAQYESDHLEELKEKAAYLDPELLGLGRLTPEVARALESLSPSCSLDEGYIFIARLLCAPGVRGDHHSDAFFIYLLFLFFLFWDW